MSLLPSREKTSPEGPDEGALGDYPSFLDDLGSRVGANPSSVRFAVTFSRKGRRNASLLHKPFIILYF
jgi:hypothetical protein